MRSGARGLRGRCRLSTIRGKTAFFGDGSIARPFLVAVVLSFKTACVVWHVVVRLQSRRRQLAAFEARKLYKDIEKKRLPVQMRNEYKICIEKAPYFNLDLGTVSSGQVYSLL